MPMAMFAQEKITGTVTDTDNLPIPGATVIIKNTTSGVVSDIDGKFSISASSLPQTILVSYLGFETVEMEVATTAPLNITLEESLNVLNEVVLIGYGEVARKDVTGSVTTVKPNEDALIQNVNVEGLLQGRAAGVYVQSSGSNPTAPTSIQIRGQNSLTGNTQPLYVIDGIIVDSATEDTLDPLSGGSSYLAPQAGISGVNPRDIESIEILKDASATAIYGSRGANGVVLITTKKGKKGETRYNFSTTTSVGNITNNIDVLGPEDYVAYQNEYRDNLGFAPTFFTYPDGSFAEFQESEDFMLANANNIQRLEPVDWSDDIYTTSLTTNHRLTASGGGENSNFYIGGGYLKNEGIVPRTEVERVDFVMNLKNELSSKFTLNTKVSAEYTENSASKGTENLGGTNNSLIRQIVSGVPFRNFSGNNEGEEILSESLDGPRAWLEDYDDLSSEVRLLGSLQADYKLSKIFTYRLQVGTDYRNKTRQLWYGTALARGRQSNGEAGLSTLERFRYNIDNTLRFKKRFNNNHRINGTVGAVIDQSNIKRTTQQASNFANKDLRADGIGFGQVQQPIFYDKQGETIVSFLGRLNYTLMNKFLFTATFRADGSSKFAEGDRFSYFPAFAFDYKLNEEKFMQKFENLSTAKLRLGYGLTGNQGIPNYRTIVPFGPTATPYANGNDAANGVIPTNLANPFLTWETTTQYNAGIDLGFYNERFTATVDVYYKNISDLLLNVEIGPSSGFSNYFANQGDLINKGIEFSVNADIISTDNFKWNVFGNIAFNKNKIDNLGLPLATFGNQTYSAFLGAQVSGGSYFKVPANMFIEVEEPGLFYGFETNGIISNDAQLANAPSYRGAAAQLGDVALVDQNGDGVVNDQDLTIIGNPNPDFNFGFGTGFTYKNISLSAFFNGVQGNDIANGNLLREGFAENNQSNIRTEAFTNAWRPDNTNGTAPRVGYDSAAETGFTDRLIEDGSFLRLSNVTVSYNIPLTSDNFFRDISLSLSGQNLLLFTDYSGYDPEVNSFSFDPGRVGIDWNSFPNQRSYSLTLNASF